MSSRPTRYSLVVSRPVAVHYFRFMGTVSNTVRKLREQPGSRVELSRYPTRAAADEARTFALTIAAHGAGRLGRPATMNAFVERLG